MSELLENINTDSTQAPPEIKGEDIDAEIDKVLAMTPMKKTRKPLSEENKQKKRDLLAKSRLVKTVNAQNKVEIEKKYKEKLNTIDNLDTIIEKKVIEKIPVKTTKPPKDKAKKQEDRIKQIDDIVNIRLEQKLKSYKPVKQMTDLDLIKKFF